MSWKTQGCRNSGGLGKTLKSFDKESKEHVGKVEREQGRGLEGSVPSKLVLEEKSVFVCKGVKCIQAQC